MGRLQSSGIDATVKMLQNLSLEVRAQPEMIQAGAKVLVEEWKAVIEEKGHVESGDMRDSVEATPPREVPGGVAVEVYPQGNDRNGVRNATKAFLLHYGWKRGKKSKKDKSKGSGAAAGDHFVDEIEARATQKAVDAMQAELNRIIEQNT